MNGYGWLSVIAAVASILASGATVLAHFRINRMQRTLLLSTSGSKSPISVAKDMRDPVIIQSGANVTLNYNHNNTTTLGGGVPTQPDISTPTEASSADRVTSALS